MYDLSGWGVRGEVGWDPGAARARAGLGGTGVELDHIP